MKKVRICLHWQLQSLADWLWDRQLLKVGNVACRLAALIYPKECKAAPEMWNGHW